MNDLVKQLEKRKLEEQHADKKTTEIVQDNVQEPHIPETPQPAA